MESHLEFSRSNLMSTQFVPVPGNRSAEINLRRDRRKPAKTHIRLTQPVHTSSVPVCRIWHDRYRLYSLPTKTRGISPWFSAVRQLFGFLPATNSVRCICTQLFPEESAAWCPRHPVEKQCAGIVESRKFGHGASLRSVNAGIKSVLSETSAPRKTAL